MVYKSSKINHIKKLATNERVSVSFAEILAKKDIKTNDFQGNQECESSCYRSATKVKELL